MQGGEAMNNQSAPGVMRTCRPGAALEHQLWWTGRHHPEPRKHSNAQRL